MGELRTRAEVAEHLRISERTLRRLLPNVPGLTYIKVGRGIRFNSADVARIERELRCPYTIDCAVKSGTSEAQSGSVGKRSKYQSTPQDAALDEMRRLRAKARQQRSANASLTANPRSGSTR